MFTHFVGNFRSPGVQRKIIHSSNAYPGFFELGLPPWQLTSRRRVVRCKYSVVDTVKLRSHKVAQKKRRLVIFLLEQLTKNMTIIYAVVCRAKDAAILTEVCDRDIKGTFGSVMVELLQHLRDHPDFFKEGDLKTFVQRNQAERDFFSHFLEACSAALGDDDDATADSYFHLYFTRGVYYCCLADDSDARDQKVYVVSRNCFMKLSSTPCSDVVTHDRLNSSSRLSRSLLHTEISPFSTTLNKNLSRCIERGALGQQMRTLWIRTLRRLWYVLVLTS